MKFNFHICSKKYILAIVAVVLILSVSIGSTMAYFVATAKTQGSAKVNLGTQTTITEELDGLNKIITVTNDGTNDAYVRVSVNCDTEDVTISYDAAQSAGWIADGDAYYFSTPLKAGADTDGNVTTPLYISVTPGESLTHAFDVVVVQESTQANFADGDVLAANNASYPGWTLMADDAIGYNGEVQ